jgi:hypothetical protein
MEYKVAICSITVFNNMIQHKVPSWFQKRNLMQLLEEKIQFPLQELEQMLVQGQILSTPQQELYDACIEIDAKQTAIKQAMHNQVDHGQLTIKEKEFLLEQVQGRINEINHATPNSGGGTSTTNPQRIKAQERQGKLLAIQPIPLPPLKHAVALGKLWKQAAPLLYLQSKSGQLTLQETKKLGQLDDMLAEIDQLEQDSHGWLEDDEVFNARIQAYRRDLQQKYKTNSMGGSSTATKGKASNVGGSGRNVSKSTGSGGGGNGGGTKKSSTNAWSSSSTILGNNTTKVQLPTSTTAWMSAKDKKAQALQSKKAKLKKGDVFGAMMMDSDSDDNDDDDDDDDEVSTKMKYADTRNNNVNVNENDNSTMVSLQPDTQSAKSSLSSNLLLSSTSQSNNMNTNGINNVQQQQRNKKKKKTKSSDKSPTQSDDTVATIAAQSSTSTSSTTTTTKLEDDHSNNTWMTMLLTLLQCLVSFLVTILTWIFSSLLVGDNNRSKTKNKKV